ncbi:hypothetical protein LEP1GSC045_0250 [Leptospira interrogans serovar Pomona str. Kennewicki LC82-25]|nr:hypothetical protein LEP1GSC045_0250 [Leptospira interrogans serovar Pomona str. Kennewicki LC82-25]
MWKNESSICFCFMEKSMDAVLLIFTFNNSNGFLIFVIALKRRFYVKI